MHIIDTECWSCHLPMKMAMILLPHTFVGPERFSIAQLNLAKSRGVLFEVRPSIFGAGNANVCSHCNKHIGPFFIHEYLDSPSSTEVIDLEKMGLGEVAEDNSESDEANEDIKE